MSAPTSERHEPSGYGAGIAFAVAAAVAFGTVAILAKLAYQRGAEPIPLLAVRFVVAGALLAGYQRAARTVSRIGGSNDPSRVSRRSVVNLILVGAFGYGVEATLFFVALEHAPAQVVTLIFYSYPLWTTIIGFATGLEPFGWSMVGALAIGGLGVAAIFSQGLETSGVAGPVLALLAALAVAIYFSIAQVVTRGISPAASAMWNALGAAIALLAVTTASRSGLPADAAVPAVALGVVTAFAFVTMFAALARIGAARTSVAAMLEPVTTVVLAWIVLGEAITARIGIGAALVVSTLPILAVAGRRRAAAPPPTAPPV